MIMKSKYLNEDFWSVNTYGFYIEIASFPNDFYLHTHEFDELFIICSGSVDHIIANKSYSLGKGDVFVMKHGIPHGFKNAKNIQLINIMYHHDFLLTHTKELRLIRGFGPLFTFEPELRLHGDYPYVLNLDSRDLHHIKNFVQLIIEVFDERNPEDYTILKMMMLSLMSLLSRKYNVSAPECNKIELLYEASNYMQKEISGKIKLEHVAHYCNISTRHLQRLFYEYYKMSPIEYLTKLRMETALYLIVDCNMQIKQAAQKTGFHDYSYFSRIFKTYFGFTPRVISKLLRTENTPS